MHFPPAILLLSIIIKELLQATKKFFHCKMFLKQIIKKLKIKIVILIKTFYFYRITSETI
jgi:hypothetical protein